MNCRHCGHNLTSTFIDLGSSPPSNAYLTEKDLLSYEKWFPLKVLICDQCWLAQTEDYASPEDLFNSNYSYFSSYSSEWLDHCKLFVSQAIKELELDESSVVIEVASNDGYLLQFVKEKNINCIGIEPTESTAKASREKGIETIEEFFGVELAQKMINSNIQADLLIANNVLAHVPDINDFLKGFSILLNENGVATFEFPHLLRLKSENQFDTIYHEHFSYLSIYALKSIFERNNLDIYHVEELETHGGSLRVYAQRLDCGNRRKTKKFTSIYNHELDMGINSLEFYSGFQASAESIKNNFLQFLIDAKKDGKSVAAYGAAAKGNTLINFAGVKKDLINFVVDKNPHKQSKFLPGSRIPIKNEEYLYENTPDYLVILPWNLQNEIISQLRDLVEDKKLKFVIVIPQLKII